MGIHDEAELSRCTVFEAEMRRRLWWAFTLLDSRVAQLASSKVVTLDPSWDCKVPSNLNDSDLRPDMNELPINHGQATESLFTTVRDEMADFVRHSEAHLDFTNPAWKPMARHLRDTAAMDPSGLKELEDMIERKYLGSCDPGNPIHYVTIWTARSHLAKCYLMDHLSQHSGSCTRWPRAQRDAVFSYALRMLECDTMIMKSPLVKGFKWFNHFYFPFLAYLHLIQDLKTRPVDTLMRRAWDVMNENYDPWFRQAAHIGYLPVFRLFANIVLGAWTACAATAEQAGEVLALPDMVTSLRALLAELSEQAGTDINEQIDSYMSGITGLFPATSTQPQPSTDHQTSLFTMPAFGNGANMSGQPQMFLSPADKTLTSNVALQGTLNTQAGNQLDWPILDSWPGWSL
jgi:hypothetical protein